MSGIDDIVRQSEAHRASITLLADELREHLTPASIVHELLGDDFGRDLMEEAGYQFRRQLRRNPVPVAIIGLGIAWLLLANARGRGRVVPLHDGLDYEDFVALQRASKPGILQQATRAIRHWSGGPGEIAHSPALMQEVNMTNMNSGTNAGRMRTNGSGAANDAGAPEPEQGLAGRTLRKTRDASNDLSHAAAEKAKNIAGQTQQMATDLAHTALHKSGEAIGSARDAVESAATSLMERTNEMARRTGRTASNSANRASSGLGQIAREQPLLVAGIGFALGVALGALVPLSRMENDMLGEQAERLKDRAKELASDGYEKVKSVAQQSYEAATDTLKSATEGEGNKSSAGEQGSTGTSGATYGSEHGGDKTNSAYRH